jgi:hypothetical protein
MREIRAAIEADDFAAQSALRLIVRGVWIEPSVSYPVAVARRRVLAVAFACPCG